MRLLVILQEFCIVFAFTLIGQGISMILPFPFPGSIISMILLLVFLFCKFLKEEKIKNISDFFLPNMAFFFIPAGVGIMENFEILKDCILPFLIIGFVSTIITFAVTAYTVSLVIKLQQRSERDE